MSKCFIDQKGKRLVWFMALCSGESWWHHGMWHGHASTAHGLSAIVSLVTNKRTKVKGEFGRF